MFYGFVDSSEQFALPIQGCLDLHLDICRCRWGGYSEGEGFLKLPVFRFCLAGDYSWIDVRSSAFSVSHEGFWE